jgi:chromosome segregation ATPase
LQKYFDEKYILINKLKELEKNCDILQKERTQYEIDYKVLSTKYNEIIKKYEKNNLELINIRQIHDNELYNIDNKINDLSKEVEKLQNENFELRREIETQRSNNNTIEKERDMFKEKYEEQKYENDLLNKKIFEVEKGYSEALKKNEYDRYFKKEKEENYRNKNETKAKIAQELQSKIQKYRRERLQNKNNED